VVETAFFTAGGEPGKSVRPLDFIPADSIAVEMPEDRVAAMIAAYTPGKATIGDDVGQEEAFLPHIHVLITCGAFAPEGDFLELPQFYIERLSVAWQEAVFALYLSEEKVEPEVVENMRTWHGHRRAAMVGGFSVDQSVFLPAADQAGIERLIQYMTRCPFSLWADSGERHVYQADQPQELTYVDINTFLATFHDLTRV